MNNATRSSVSNVFDETLRPREQKERLIGFLTPIKDKILCAVESLETFEEMGLLLSAIYNLECDYRLLHVSRNYLIYRIELDRIIIVEMFDERENFMYKLFGIRTLLQDDET